MRQALVDHGETFPPQTGQPIQTPTARWVLHSFVGIHWLRMPGEGAMVLHLNDEHRKLLRLLGKPYEGFSPKFHEIHTGSAECRLKVCRRSKKAVIFFGLIETYPNDVLIASGASKKQIIQFCKKTKASRRFIEWVQTDKGIFAALEKSIAVFCFKSGVVSSPRERDQFQC